MIDDSDRFDSEESRRRRDAGMKLVADNDPTFSFLYFHFILALPIGWRGTNEDIIKMWPHAEPHHPNCWGSNWGACKKRGLLVELRERVPMTAKRSHARRTNIHMRVRPQ